jgi:hypothetical protein
MVPKHALLKLYGHPSNIATRDASIGRSNYHVAQKRQVPGSWSDIIICKGVLFNIDDPNAAKNELDAL